MRSHLWPISANPAYLCLSCQGFMLIILMVITGEENIFQKSEKTQALMQKY